MASTQASGSGMAEPRGSAPQAGPSTETQVAETMTETIITAAPAAGVAGEAEGSKTPAGTAPDTSADRAAPSGEQGSGMEVDDDEPGAAHPQHIAGSSSFADMVNDADFPLQAADIAAEERAQPQSTAIPDVFTAGLTSESAPILPPSSGSAIPTTINPSILAPVQPFHSSSSSMSTPLNPALSRASGSMSGSRSSRSARVPSPAGGRPRAYRTGYIYDIMMLLHCQDGYTPTEDSVVDSGDGHPEEPMRIKRIYMRLKEAGLIGRMKKLEFEPVTQEQAVMVHTEEHWAKVESTRELSDESIEASKNYYEQLSLYVCRETAHCARLSCGGVIQACISVCKGEVRNAFAIVRPPGHHAEPDEHMGFCFFNNVAVAAKEVQRLGLAKKVLILDWDVHHGNGTQRAFYDDPDVLYISIHRHDGGKFYPSSDFGALDMVGYAAGRGTSVNIPWPGSGHGDADYLYAFQKIVMPIAYEFAPDLVIISAGFDAAEGDTLGGCLVTPPAYGHMTHMLCAVAGGKVVVALEGGYNLQAISDSALAVGQVLLGEPPAELPALQASEVATEVMHQVAKIQSEFWKSIDVKACEPPEVDDTDEMPVRTSIPDLLKQHRAHHLFSKHGLFQIPLASEMLEESFKGQVASSPNVCDIKPDDVLVVFVHDFGNLRVETDGVKSTNIHMTNSYLLDTSTAVINWINEQKYEVIDINVLAALPTTMSRGTKSTLARGPKLQLKLMQYIWDNYVELSESDNVVLIGHGTACAAIMDLINSRSVESRVKAVVQVAGMHSMVRIDPHNEGLGQWFRSASQVFLPRGHPILENERIARKIGGQVQIAEDSEKVVDVLNAALPQIKAFVAAKVGGEIPQSQASSANGQGSLNANGNGNGHADLDGTAQPPATASVNGTGAETAAAESNENGMEFDGEETRVEVSREVEVVQASTITTEIITGEDEIMV